MTDLAQSARVQDQLAGLTSAEVAAREAQGQVNRNVASPKRTIGQILRANMCTRFNAILGALLAVIVVIGPYQDALFGVVLVTNTAIGIIQEVRAKRTLDRLSLLATPRAVARRNGDTVELPTERVVVDDVLRLQTGDQVVVDGALIAAEGLELDESLLTGEADPVAKDAGDEVLSGSFVAAGCGWYRATRVGLDAYAARLAREARRFTLVHSELRDGIDRVLRWVTFVMIPTAALLVSSQLIHNKDLADALRGSVAGVGSMIPEGLVLLTSVALAVGVVRLGRRRVLVQELAAIETLARVDVVCLDKTGTLTQGAMTVADVDVLAPLPVHEALGALAAADPSPNASMRAIAAGYPEVAGWRAEGIVPFSSARKWSAASFGVNGSWYLGAPEIMLAHATNSVEAEAAGAQAAARAAKGQRVLLLARSRGSLDAGDLAPHLEPAALIALSDPIRSEAAATLDYFSRQGVQLKILSGDDPRTVGAVAAGVGICADAAPIDARFLSQAHDDRLAEAMDRHTVFGRVAPHQKRAMVAALQSRGHVVAMIGDGVNDVLALKEADIGVAIASGSAASRAVAQLVLVDNDFDALPAVVGEGRRVIANIERVASLFLTKTVYATLLALAVGAARLPFPFLPRHLTIVTALTIGTPAFFLALAPNSDRADTGFVRRVLTFAVPAGTVAAAATFLTYALARAEGVALASARTMATIALFAVAFWVLTVVARPLTFARRALLAGLACSFVCVLASAPLRDLFGLILPAVGGWTTVALVDLAAIATLEGGWRIARSARFLRSRRRQAGDDRSPTKEGPIDSGRQAAGSRR